MCDWMEDCRWHMMPREEGDSAGRATQPSCSLNVGMRRRSPSPPAQPLHVGLVRRLRCGLQLLVEALACCLLKGRGGRWWIHGWREQHKAAQALALSTAVLESTAWASEAFGGGTAFSPET